uniref:SBE1-1 n=1 Tax=Solanum tuberosum TaxID=4113 RepID=A0A290WH17_SOLTU|nr:SBE1-1 [Solanum tuberosum]
MEINFKVLSKPIRGSFPSFSPKVSSGASRNKICFPSQHSTGLKFGSQERSWDISSTPKSRVRKDERMKHSSAISAVLTDDNSTMAPLEEDVKTENIGLLNLDPTLEPYLDHFRHRMKRYVDQKMLIEKYEGPLEEFAQGYLKFGFNREDGCIVYRKWAPAAQEAEVIGDFNGWNGSNHMMEKDQFGVWSIRIPDVDSKPVIPHNSRVKFRFKHGNGVWVDRIPAWIKYATADATKFAAPYDGVYWDPPPSERYHKLWDSRLFNYANWEVLRFLLSNLRWWLEEYNFDGFRFDGITSMLYVHHGINMGFTGNYNEYFSEATDVDAVVYLMLANNLIHKIFPDATVIAEDVSGMPGLGRPVSEGGIGFDYRLAMAIPDKWIDYLKNKNDEDWSMKEVTSSLTNRRYTEKCIAYAESHDQSIVGDKTIAFLLMDKEMYSGMSCLTDASPVVDRGIALHKMIHFFTMALGGEGYLNFMGNEFGHPEWIDFPREGNNWSYDKCRRQWNLADSEHLRYKFMNAFDRAMNSLDEKFSFLTSGKQIVSSMDDDNKVVVFERGDLVFVFNFHPKNTYEGYKVGCDLPGKYRVALDSDAWEFGGHGRTGHDVDHFTSPEGIPGVPETNFNGRPNSFKVLSPARTCVAYYRVDERMSETEDYQTDICSELLPTANIEESDEKLKDSLSTNISNIDERMSETEVYQTDISSELLPTANIEESDEKLKDSLSTNIST